MSATCNLSGTHGTGSASKGHQQRSAVEHLTACDVAVEGILDNFVKCGLPIRYPPRINVCSCFVGLITPRIDVCIGASGPTMTEGSCLPSPEPIFGEKLPAGSVMFEVHRTKRPLEQSGPHFGPVGSFSDSPWDRSSQARAASAPCTARGHTN